MIVRLKSTELIDIPNFFVVVLENVMPSGMRILQTDTISVSCFGFRREWHTKVAQTTIVMTIAKWPLSRALGTLDMRHIGSVLLHTN